MKLNGIKFTDFSGLISRVIYDDVFLLAIIDWNGIDNDNKVAILNSMGFEEFSDVTAKQKCSMAIIVPVANGGLDLDNCRLHISTIGRLPDTSIHEDVKEYLTQEEIKSENIVELSTQEKIAILKDLIPSIDMREVI